MRALVLRMLACRRESKPESHCRIVASSSQTAVPDSTPCRHLFEGQRAQNFWKDLIKIQIHLYVWFVTLRRESDFQRHAHFHTWHEFVYWIFVLHQRAALEGLQFHNSNSITEFTQLSLDFVPKGIIHQWVHFLTLHRIASSLAEVMLCESNHLRWAFNFESERPSRKC